MAVQMEGRVALEGALQMRVGLGEEDATHSMGCGRG